MSEALLIRYRRSDADDQEAWMELPPFPPFTERVEIPGLEVGVAYDVRVRRIEDGVESAEVSIDGHVVSGDQSEPIQPDGLVIAGGCLLWRAPIDRETVVGFEVRVAFGDVRAWGEMIPVHDGLWEAPPLPMCAIPSGTITIAVVAVNRHGVRSTPAYLIAANGDLEELETVTSRVIDHAALGWPGTIVNGSVSTGAVRGTAVVSGPYGPAAVRLYGPYGAGVEYGPDGEGIEYGTALPDARRYGSDDPTALYGATEYGDLVYLASPVFRAFEVDPDAVVTVNLASTRPGYRIELRRRDYAYGPTDPAWAYGPDPGATDLYGPAEGGGWRPWPGRMPARAGLHEFRVTVPGGVVRPVLSALTFTVSHP